MEPAAIEELEAALGYTFRQRETLLRALTHSSLAYEKNTGAKPASGPKSGSKRGSKPGAIAGPGLKPASAAPAHPEDNEQLEFLGDAVLGLVVAEALYREHPAMSEGQLTRLRAALVSRKHMGQVGSRLELGRYMLLGRGEERSGGRKKAALLANAAEALIAAVYLDGGFESARHLIQTQVIAPSLQPLLAEAERGANIGDHKSALQEFLQAEHRGQPEYLVAGQSGPDHRKRFLVEVRIPSQQDVSGKALARGVGSTKKHAEQEAARRALQKLRSERRPEGLAAGVPS